MEEALRIERFAKDTLLDLWNIDNEKISESDSTKEIIYIVYYRFWLFYGKHWNELKADYDHFKSDNFVFYQYLRKNMNRFILYPGMMIFDKMLMSLAVVLTMGVVSKKSKNTIYQNTGPLAWAMYFETEWKEMFYEAGGFKELKLYAKSCHTYRFSELKPMYLLSPHGFDLALDLMVSLRDSYYQYDQIIKAFLSLKGLDDCSSCSNCLPLFEALLSLSDLQKYKQLRYRDVRLVEGFTQLIFRTVDEESATRLYDSFWDSIVCENEDEKADLARTKTIAALHEIHLKLLFADEYRYPSEEAKKDRNLNLCMFCGRKYDKRDVPRLVSIIRKKASEVYSDTEGEASPDEQAETENALYLRFVIALGMEPTTSRVRTSIGKEFGTLESSQDLSDSRDTLEDEVKDKSYRKSKKNKNKKR